MQRQPVCASWEQPPQARWSEAAVQRLLLPTNPVLVLRQHRSILCAASLLLLYSLLHQFQIWC